MEEEERERREGKGEKIIGDTGGEGNEGDMIGGEYLKWC